MKLQKTKKKKEKDFKKVKIKAGKKIKRLDDTRTDFKSRKIRINESTQLRNNATKMLLNKNLKVNSKLKLNAFEKMNVNLENINLDNITGETINGLAKYLLDFDERIRSEFIKTIKSCFEKLKKNNQSLTPYIKILFIYIKCGLTHLDINIVKDSKKLLELVLQFIEKGLDNNLIEVINSRIKNDSYNLTLIDLELIELVLKIVYKKKTTEKIDKKVDFIWSTKNCFLNFDEKDNSDFEFNLSFPAIENKDDLYEEFINKINVIINKEVSSRYWEKTYSKEIKRKNVIINICKILEINTPIYQ